MQPVLTEEMARGKGCMFDWADALKAVSPGHAFLKEFRRQKYEIYPKIRDAGMPAPEFISMPLEKLKREAEKHVSALKAGLFYMLIEKRGDSSVRSAAGQITKKDLRRMLRSIPASDDLMVTIIEETECLLEGTVMVDREGLLSAEFSLPENTPLTRGGRVPDFRVESTPCTNLLRYSSDDTRTKIMLLQALGVVPFNREERVWHPGYYEVSLVLRPGEEIPRAFVHDFRDHWV